MSVFETIQKPKAWTVCQASTTKLLSSSTQLADATHFGWVSVEAIAQELCQRRWHLLWVQGSNEPQRACLTLCKKVTQAGSW
jgi:hypothetical protein